VVETGFNDRSWLDMAGHPHSESLHVTERCRRVDFGHIPAIQQVKNYQPDMDMLEVSAKTSGIRRIWWARRMQAGSSAWPSGAVCRYVRVFAKGRLASRPAATHRKSGGWPIRRALAFDSTIRDQQWFGGESCEFSRDSSGTVTSLKRMGAEDHPMLYRKH
jgi:hypothetical protein